MVCKLPIQCMCLVLLLARTGLISAVARRGMARTWRLFCATSCHCWEQGKIISLLRQGWVLWGSHLCESFAFFLTPLPLLCCCYCSFSNLITAPSKLFLSQPMCLQLSSPSCCRGAVHGLGVFWWEHHCWPTAVVYKHTHVTASCEPQGQQSGQG